MLSDTSRLPRNKRTPYTEDMAVFARVKDFSAKPLSKRSLNSLSTEYDFIQNFIVPMLNEQARGDELEEKLSNLVETTDVEKIPTLLVALVVCGMYTIKAVVEHKRGNNETAWAFVGDAQFWLGILLGGNQKTKSMMTLRSCFPLWGKKEPLRDTPLMRHLKNGL